MNAPIMGDTTVVTDSGSAERSLRLLVTIASYGEKNLDLLKRIIQVYRSMPMHVDVVVISNAPKQLDPEVRVVVGLPSRNPWSLPFAHKSILAQNIDSYDLFVYSEDDMEVTERNVRAFLRATPHLTSDEIAGFLRYEVDKSGVWSLPDVHGPFHWRPESVIRRGEYVVAEFSNDHSACYVLTQAQLRKAITSGGFLREPYEGRHDMLCTAATDPYTSCGFRKVICISALEDFLVHHLSDRYAKERVAGQIGLPLLECKKQIETLNAILEGSHPVSTLCEVESRMLHRKWSKSYYEEPSQELLTLVPNDARQILSIGCGWGATEACLRGRGATVTAIPLDSIIGAAAAHRGIDVVYGSLESSLGELGSRTFDCVFMTNLLHLLPNPREAVERCSQLVRKGGTLVISGPNFDSLRVRAKRLVGREGHRNLGAYERSGVHMVGPSVVDEYLGHAGLTLATVRWPSSAVNGGIEGRLGRLGSASWVLQAGR